MSDTNNPARKRYLARFADEEGRVFLSRFHEKYLGHSSDQSLENPGAGHPPYRAARGGDLQSRAALGEPGNSSLNSPSARADSIAVRKRP